MTGPDPGQRCVGGVRFALSHRAAFPGLRRTGPGTRYLASIRRLSRALHRRARAHPQTPAERALRAGLPGGYPRDRDRARPRLGRAAGQPDTGKGRLAPVDPQLWPRMSKPAPRPSKSWIELLARNYYLFRVSPKRSQDTVRCGGGVISPLPANCCSCGSFIDGPISQKIGVAHPAVVP